MSELKVNKISPASGTAFTLGDSGDTFTIPSGATIANSGTATGFVTAGALDLNGAKLTIDANGNTSITSDTDDQIDFEIAGADDFQMTAFVIAPPAAIATVPPDAALNVEPDNIVNVFAVI